MTQNRNKLIELFISNISNIIVHNILENAIKNERLDLEEKYRKELINSFNIAKKYREKINPINDCLPYKHSSYIKNKIKNKVITELKLRINKGYKNINLSLINIEVNKVLKKLMVE